MRDLKLRFKVSDKALDYFFKLIEEAEVDEKNQMESFRQYTDDDDEAEEFEYSASGWEDEMAYHAFCLLRSCVEEEEDAGS